MPVTVAMMVSFVSKDASASLNMPRTKRKTPIFAIRSDLPFFQV